MIVYDVHTHMYAQLGEEFNRGVSNARAEEWAGQWGNTLQDLWGSPQGAASRLTCAKIPLQTLRSQWVAVSSEEEGFRMTETVLFLVVILIPDSRCFLEPRSLLQTHFSKRTAARMPLLCGRYQAHVCLRLKEEVLNTAYRWGAICQTTPSTTS